MWKQNSALSISFNVFLRCCFVLFSVFLENRKQIFIAGNRIKICTFATWRIRRSPRITTLYCSSVMQICSDNNGYIKYGLRYIPVWMERMRIALLPSRAESFFSPAGWRRDGRMWICHWMNPLRGFQAFNQPCEWACVCLPPTLTNLWGDLGQVQGSGLQRPDRRSTATFNLWAAVGVSCQDLIGVSLKNISQRCHLHLIWALTYPAQR